MNGRVAVNGDSANKRAGKHKSPELDDLSKINILNVFHFLKQFLPDSIFAPRSEDCGEMDPADREIEQFKLFCRDSVPVQNRTKVSFDVRNIAFKKK